MTRESSPNQDLPYEEWYALGEVTAARNAPRPHQHDVVLLELSLLLSICEDVFRIADISQTKRGHCYGGTSA
jgi:hypothetical protein